MAREDFIDSLRRAYRLLAPAKVSSGQGAHSDARISSLLNGSDLWLTPKSVEGFDPADFEDWPKEDREELSRQVTAFLEAAERVAPNRPAQKVQSKHARKHLERVLDIVGKQLLHEWLAAQQELMDEARAAAEAKGWYVHMDKKDVLESLLGSYEAPRLRIRTNDMEVVLDPVARFGSGRQGVVDLVVMPTYETAYLVAFKNDRWQIISPHGTAHGRPFTQAALVNTIARLSHS